MIGNNDSYCIRRADMVEGLLTFDACRLKVP